MSLSGYDLRRRAGKRQRRLSWRKRKPRDLRIAGFLVYGLVLWGVTRLPQKEISLWLASLTPW